MIGIGKRALALALPLALSAPVQATTDEPATAYAATGYYYAMRDEPDFGAGIATLDHGALHLEARYNYEARNSASLFAGWKFSGGDTIAYTVTPILGALVGSARGLVAGVETSIGWREFDIYIEAEYVQDRTQASGNYYYAWNEIAWKPTEWLRVGLAGQRTRIVDNGRALQAGAFAQILAGKATLAVYAFNPDSGSRYAIIALGAQF